MRASLARWSAPGWLGRTLPFITAATAIAAVLYSGQSLRLTQESNQHQYELARQQQAADRYTKATELLGAKDSTLQVRLGALYSLGQLATDFPDQRFPVVSSLAAYLRETHPTADPLVSMTDVPRSRNCKTLTPTPLAQPDVDAAIGVLASHVIPGKPTASRNWVNVANTCLQGVLLDRADLSGLDAQNAIFAFATMRRSDFRYASLSGADFSAAALYYSNLSGLEASNVCLDVTYLTGADLSNVKLRNIGAHEVQLDRANLRNAEIHRAYLAGADLTGADLTGALLSDLVLDDAVLTDANLTDVKFDRVHYNSGTLWPAGFVPPPST
ncbi:pentapeptide repeat-containing protein [Nocardia xishanensis]|uniref:pentapeptide repeat-containing protein n=1 Tax=Nocardia xishanensis TaxID=238964 RepID=UPI003414C08B